MNREQLEAVYDENLTRYLRDWSTLLAFPSVSSDPEHEVDCRACAGWLSEHLTDMGIDAQLLETETKPVVYGSRPAAPGRPTVLFYGHYDVQPPDPLDQWVSHPFKPALQNGRMYGRGAQDNKGQLFYVLKALETLIHAGRLNVGIKVFLEGEEETGAASTEKALPDWKDKLDADVLMVADTGTVRSGAPTIIMGLRGIVHVGLALRGPNHDLHSGVHGGLAPNPAQGMAQLIASLFTPTGRVMVPGFYDGVHPPTKRQQELAQTAPFVVEDYAKEVGVRPAGGEPGYPPLERVGFRPSLDINGVHSGYGGPGAKTIIPSKAIAKMTMRLVPGQSPQACLSALIEHLRSHTPEGMVLDIVDQDVGGPGISLDPDSELVHRAERILNQLSDQTTAFLWEGASIPIVSSLLKASGAEPLLVGFGREEDSIHAPNESFSIEQFKQGFLYAGLMLAELGID